MSAAYLQQCGEDEVDRQSFSYGVEIAYPLAFSLASGSDAGATLVEVLPWLYDVTLDREMDPGWWQFDMEVDMPYNGDPSETRLAQMAVTYAQTPVDSSLPLNWFPRISANVVSHKMIVAYVGDSCKRQVFTLEVGVYHNDPNPGQVFTVNVTATRLACPDCPEPTP